MTRNALLATVGTAAFAAAWLPAASWLFVAAATTTMPRSVIAWTPTLWLDVLPYRGVTWKVMVPLVASAAVATLPVLVFGFLLARRAISDRLKLPRPARGPVRNAIRGESDNHGHADYMQVAEMQTVFPSTPDRDLGGVVVGEADRVDLGPAARLSFDPDNRMTWGNGGKAPLLIDPCKRGSTHSMVIGGGGTYKSTTLVTTLLTWRGSIFCLDPAEELAAIVGAELEDRGRKVVRLEIGGIGPNVLAGIDIESPLAETRLRAIVGRVIGPMSGDEKGDKFKRWGRTIILSLLAHLIWDPNTHLR